MPMSMNPFDSGFSDFGLLSSVDGDVLGSPDKVQELQNQLAGLQATLREPPPSQNNPINSAIQGALAGLQGTQENPLTGEVAAGPPPTGFAAGLLAGMNAGVEGSQADALAQYQQRQKNAQAAIDQRERLSAGVRAVLGQNPLAFEALGKTEEGKRLLGYLAYGVDIPIDPTAKQRGTEQTLQNNQRMRYLINVVRFSPDPKARADASNELDAMTGGTGLDVKPSDMINKGTIPSYAQAVKMYGDAGGRAVAQYAQDGDLSALMTKLGGMKAQDPEKLPNSVQIKSKLSFKIGKIMRDEGVTFEDAKKKLSPEDQAQAEIFLKDPTGGPKDLPISRYAEIMNQAYNDLTPEEKADPNADSLAYYKGIRRIEDAKKLKARAEKPITPPAAAAPAAQPATPENKAASDAWVKALRVRVKSSGETDPRKAADVTNREMVNEYIKKGMQDKIPAWARKQAGF